MEKIIIHISGASGSGKTFLGKQLKDKFKNKIIVKDLDDLRDEFIVNFYGSQKWTRGPPFRSSPTSHSFSRYGRLFSKCFAHCRHRRRLTGESRLKS